MGFRSWRMIRRHAWLQVVSGRVELNGSPLGAGDGAAVSQESALEMVALEPTHFLLFDLA
jgi:quercetin 2,3-dioxygenase